MMDPRILVVSSANMDITAKMIRIPAAGESFIGDSYAYIPGGKGANAALTVARLGADSIFCTKLGKDFNGEALLQFYESSGIDTRFIAIDNEESTGLAVILVEKTGANRIVVYPGANYNLSTLDVEEAFTCYPDAAFLHFEIPIDSVIAATKHAKRQNIPVFIDAGPADDKFPLEELENVEIFSPNETETFIFTGIMPSTPDKCLKACIKLSERVKAKYYVIKLGERGAFMYDGKYYKMFAPHEVNVVDTTAAGDAFSAALTVEYMTSHDIKRACEYANIVGALTVSKEGASPSIPTASEVKNFIIKNDINYRL